jgi:hypothetical protein
MLEGGSWDATSSSMYIRVCTPEGFDGFYSYSAFNSLPLISRCLVTVNIIALKIGAFHRGLQTQNGNFPENGSNNFD